MFLFWIILYIRHALAVLLETISQRFQAVIIIMMLVLCFIQSRILNNYINTDSYKHTLHLFYPQKMSVSPKKTHHGQLSLFVVSTTRGQQLNMSRVTATETSRM